MMMMMRTSGRRKLRRLLQQLLWSHASLRYDSKPALPNGFDPAWSL